MSQFPQLDANRRAPRVHLHGTVAAAIHGERGQRSRAKLQSLSITGGLLQLDCEMEAGDFIEIAFHTRSGAIQGMAEMLPPAHKDSAPNAADRKAKAKSACLQPFRFVALGDDDHRKLRMALDAMLDRAYLESLSNDLRPPDGL